MFHKSTNHDRSTPACVLPMESNKKKQIQALATQHCNQHLMLCVLFCDQCPVNKCVHCSVYICVPSPPKYWQCCSFYWLTPSLHRYKKQAIGKHCHVGVSISTKSYNHSNLSNIWEQWPFNICVQRLANICVPSQVLTVLFLILVNSHVAPV